MDAIPSSFLNRRTKIENSLLDLSKEISSAIKFLTQLEENAERKVTNLNSLISPSDYLKEFVSVNSYLFKYLNILNEINCKFEMLYLSETECKVERYDKIHKVKAIDICTSSDLTTKIARVSETTESCKILDDDSQENFRETNTLSIKPLKKANSYESCLDNKSENQIVEGQFNDSYDKNFKGQRTIESKQLIETNENTFITFPDNSLKTNQASNFEEKCNQYSVVQLVPQFQSTPSKNENSCNDFTTRKKSQVSESLSKSNLKNDQIVKDDIKPLSISRNVGEEFEVSVEHIKSPSEFYVHIKSNDSNLLNNLENRLKLFSLEPSEINHKKNEKKNLIAKLIGKYGLYYSKCDEVWCRVQITDWCDKYKEKYVSIFLIDYGESKCVSIDTLQPLPDFLKSYPAFAQKCHLYGVYPADMNENSDLLVWGRDSSEKMRNLIENSNALKIRVASNDRFHSPSSLPVILYLTDKGNESVNDLLVKSKYAIQVLENSENTFHNSCYSKKMEECENLENWNPMKEDFESYKNNYDLDINDPAAVIYGYVGKDYDRICMQYSKTGKCFKGSACRKEHSHLDPNGYTTDQEEIYKNAFTSLTVPSVSSILNIQVTCLLEIDKFCCIKEIVGFDNNEENLNTLVKAINEEEAIRKFKKLLIPPSVGQIVLAQFIEDDSWYRAKILDSQPENDIYSVLFVDYGNKESIPFSKIRAIEPKYLHLPFQAIFCNIHGIKKNPKVSKYEALEYLNRKFSENIISIEVISKLPGDSVNLTVNVFDHNGENIGKNLITKGYAIFKEEISFDINCETLPG